MNLPSATALMTALEESWPAASVRKVEGWQIREGQGGGQRVSAASPHISGSVPDIETAEKAMEELGQSPLFRLTEADAALDHALHQRGYELNDATQIYAGALAGRRRDVRWDNEVFHAWPMLALQKTCWQHGGIGPARLAVMDRVEGPKTTFLARSDQALGGVAFAAISGDIAMVHALHVEPDQRRKAVASKILAAVGDWAQDMGARYLALAATKENFAANALYVNIMLTPVVAYHYRRKQQ